MKRIVKLTESDLTRIVKRVIKEDINDISFVDARSEGIVEVGFITIMVDGEEIIIYVEQKTNRKGEYSETYLLEDPKYYRLLKSHGVKFDGEEIIGPDNFLYDLHDFYSSDTSSDR